MNHCPVAPERSSQGNTKQRGAWRASEAGKDASPCEVPYALDIAFRTHYGTLRRRPVVRAVRGRLLEPGRE